MPDAAREHGAHHELEKVQVAERLDEVQPRHLRQCWLEAELDELLAGSRVHRKDDREVPLQLRERHQDLSQRGGVVHVGGPVQRHERVGIVAQGQPLADRRALRLIHMADQRINHDVAHEKDLLRGDALPLKVAVGLLARGEE